MKPIFTTLIGVLASLVLSAQTTATSVTYNKAVQPAVVARVGYGEDVAKDFVVAGLAKSGNKISKGDLFSKQNLSDGFYVAHDVKLQGLNYPVDLYFKIDSKGKRSNQESMVYVMSSKSGSAFASSTSDEPTFTASRDFMNGFSFMAEAYDLQLKIADEEEALKDAQKKMEKLKDNEKDMNRKLESLQKDIKENKEDQDKLNSNLEKQIKKIEDLRDQLKKYN